MNQNRQDRTGGTYVTGNQLVMSSIDRISNFLRGILYIIPTTIFTVLDVIIRAISFAVRLLRQYTALIIVSGLALGFLFAKFKMHDNSIKGYFTVAALVAALVLLVRIAFSVIISILSAPAAFVSDKREGCVNMMRHSFRLSRSMSRSQVDAEVERYRKLPIYYDPS